MPPMRTLPYDAQKIRDLRIRAGLSIHQLADRIGCHHESLRNLERNRRNASDQMLGRIALSLGVDLEEIAPAEKPDEADSVRGAA